MTSTQTAEKIAEILADKKALDIKTYDLQGRPNALADYMLAATANSPPHLKALSASIQREMRKLGFATVRSSGDSDSAWIVIDYGDVMAHLFIAESREYYEIETLWQEPKPKPPRPPKEPKPPKEKKLPKKTKETGKKTVRKSATRSPRKTTATPRSRKK